LLEAVPGLEQSVYQRSGERPRDERGRQRGHGGGITHSVDLGGGPLLEQFATLAENVRGIEAGFAFEAELRAELLCSDAEWQRREYRLWRCV
jgi:hypothetical protein